KPVLVLRETTERPEALEAGTVELVGTSRGRVLAATRRLLDDPAAYRRMAEAVNPYGDGRAAVRIVAALAYRFGLAAEPPEEFVPPCAGNNFTGPAGEKFFPNREQESGPAA
ncbi:MAG: UDP-N-acetylglucosamine 2-epimerase, partial [Desulfotomaculales bacterium]